MGGVFFWGGGEGRGRYYERWEAGGGEVCRIGFWCGRGGDEDCWGFFGGWGGLKKGLVGWRIESGWEGKGARGGEEGVVSRGCKQIHGKQDDDDGERNGTHSLDVLCILFFFFLPLSICPLPHSNRLIYSNIQFGVRFPMEMPFPN